MKPMPHQQRYLDEIASWLEAEKAARPRRCLLVIRGDRRSGRTWTGLHCLDAIARSPHGGGRVAALLPHPLVEPALLPPDVLVTDDPEALRGGAFRAILIDHRHARNPHIIANALAATAVDKSGIVIVVASPARDPGDVTEEQLAAAEALDEQRMNESITQVPDAGPCRHLHAISETAPSGRRQFCRDCGAMRLVGDRMGEWEPREIVIGKGWRGVMPPLAEQVRRMDRLLDGCGHRPPAAAISPEQRLPNPRAPLAIVERAVQEAATTGGKIEAGDGLNLVVTKTEADQIHARFSDGALEAVRIKLLVKHPRVADNAGKWVDATSRRGMEMGREAMRRLSLEPASQEQVERAMRKSITGDPNGRILTATEAIASVVAGMRLDVKIKPSPEVTALDRAADRAHRFLAGLEWSTRPTSEQRQVVLVLAELRAALIAVHPERAEIQAPRLGPAIECPACREGWIPEHQDCDNCGYKPSTVKDAPVMPTDPRLMP
jgi:hypothetical protein